MKDRLALYDYCGTLVSNQTADAYVLAYIRANKNVVFRILAKFIKGCGLLKKNRKLLLLSLLTGEHQEDLEKFGEEYCERYLRPHTITAIASDLAQRREAGFLTVIISAGYTVYIDRHNRDLGADLVIANEFLYKNGIFTGKLVDRDCFGVQKVRRLKDRLELSRFNLRGSLFFSDCMSDKPLFAMVGRPYLVLDGGAREISNVTDKR